MAKYLYAFAYQTPQQAATQTDCPDESSAALFIEAESPEAALDWGLNVSHRFVSEQATGLTWQPEKFAHWIETCTQREYPAEILGRLPIVAVGVYPDWAALGS